MKLILRYNCLARVNFIDYQVMLFVLQLIKISVQEQDLGTQTFMAITSLPGTVSGTLNSYNCKKPQNRLGFKPKFSHQYHPSRGQPQLHQLFLLEEGCFASKEYQHLTYLHKGTYHWPNSQFACFQTAVWNSLPHGNIPNNCLKGYM